MSMILWIAVTCYIAVAITFNLAMISFWREEKELKDSGWSGSDTADLIGMFFASALWPICVIWGLIKMKEEKESEQ